VSHFGESYVYGVETIDPLAAMQLGDRAQDCSFALDHLLTDSPFREVADPSRVGALGHSSGGATVVALAGGTFDPGLMRRYCASDEAADDKGCAYGRRPGATGSVTGQTPVRRRDVRVRVVVALDPALGPGFDPGSLAGIDVPVHVVGSEENDFLPIEHHAARYARLIPGAGFTRLDRGEGHFVYLDRCAGDRDANGVPLCRDRPGVDRAEVHARLRPVIAGFLAGELAA
jgi:predicted dienelactone hydrolase